MLSKPAITTIPIHDLLAMRWSPRAFDGTRPVSREQVLALLEAGRWAPSCFGEQPWRFLVCDRQQQAQSHAQVFASLTESNQAWVKHCPLLIVVGAMPSFRHNAKDNRWAQYDSGAAAMSICLQAVALGLAAHQMGGFDAEKIRQAFAVPAEVTLMAVVAIGYQAAADILDSVLQAREVAPRQRLPLGEIAFQNKWNDPAF